MVVIRRGWLLQCMRKGADNRDQEGRVARSSLLARLGRCRQVRDAMLSPYRGQSVGEGGGFGLGGDEADWTRSKEAGEPCGLRLIWAMSEGVWAQARE